MRVTLDIDGTGFYSKMKVTVAWITLRCLSRGNQYGRRSAGGKFHLKAHGLKISFRTSIVIRLILGDDKMRIRFDLRRQLKPKQSLWTKKDGKMAGEWRRSLLEVLV